MPASASAIGPPALFAAVAALAVLTWPRSVSPRWLPTMGRRSSPERAASAAKSRAVAGQTEIQLVPEALELMALALLGGGSVAKAARSVAATLPFPLGEELRGVGAAIQAGEDPDRAWQLAGAHWLPARQSLDLASRAGVPPRDALLQAASDLRRDAVADVEVAAARLGVLLVLPLGLAFLPAFVLTTVVPVVVALTQDLTW